MRRYFALLAIVLFTFSVNAQETFPPEELANDNGQFVEVDGVSLYVESVGDPANPAVLLLHGFGGSTFTWRDNLQPIADSGYYAIAFDRPPYGLADKSTDIDYTASSYVSLTSGLMDALDIDSATLVGHSAGGNVIAHFAVTYPNRVDGLVYVAGAVRVDGGVSAAQQSDTGQSESPFAPLFDVVSNLDPDSPLAVFTARSLVTPDLIADITRANYADPESVPQDVIDGYSQILLVNGWEGALLKLVTSQEEPEPLDIAALSAIDVPTLVLWGEVDPTVPLTVGQNLAEFLDVKLIVYPEVGHLPMEEATDAFNTDLIAFLNEIDR